MKKLIFAVLLLFPLTAFSGELKYYIGNGALGHTSGLAFGAALELPNYPGAIVAYDRIEDNSFWTLNYKFRWNPLYFQVGMGLAHNQNEGIHDSVVLRPEFGLRVSEFLELGIIHWSSPGDDSGENVINVALVIDW